MTTQPETLPSTFQQLVEEAPNWEFAPEVTVICRECRKPHLHNKYLANLFPNGVCEDCSDAYVASGGSRAYLHPLETKRSLLDALLPPLYRDTDPRKLNQSILKKIMAWKPNPIGIYLVGDTRTGKTRSMCLLLEKFIHIKPKAFFHGKFHDLLLDSLKAPSNSDFREFRKLTASTPILAIDDLFAQKFTERSEAFLLETIDARTSRKLPTLVTTQVTKKEALTIFSSAARHEAFYARINEFFDVVNANPTK